MIVANDAGSIKSCSIVLASLDTFNAASNGKMDNLSALFHTSI
jgi:hypothetical protein